MQEPNIRIFEIPEHVEPFALKGSVAIVIDVLRATSSMAAALNHGCKEIYPVVDVQDAFALRDKLLPQSVKLCGERKGVKIEGFDFGNSPLEYQRSIIKDKTLVWTTSNGTKAMQHALSADWIYIASLLNLSAIAKAAAGHDQDVNILCAGTNGKPTLEDTVCAGLLAREIANIEKRFHLDSTELPFIEQAEQYENDLFNMMLQSKHGRYLQEIGFEKDLRFCSQKDFYDLNMVFDKRVVKLAP